MKSPDFASAEEMDRSLNIKFDQKVRGQISIFDVELKHQTPLLGSSRDKNMKTCQSNCGRPRTLVVSAQNLHKAFANKSRFVGKRGLIPFLGENPARLDDWLVLWPVHGCKNFQYAQVAEMYFHRIVPLLLGKAVAGEISTTVVKRSITGVSTLRSLL